MKCIWEVKMIYTNLRKRYFEETYIYNSCLTRARVDRSIYIIWQIMPGRVDIFTALMIILSALIFLIDWRDIFHLTQNLSKVIYKTSFYVLLKCYVWIYLFWKIMLTKTFLIMCFKLSMKNYNTLTINFEGIHG